MTVRDSTPLPEELPRDARQNGYYDDDDIHLAADEADDDDYFEELEHPLHAYLPKNCEMSHLLRDVE